MKNVLNKIVSVCKGIFGWGVMISLFAGGLTIVGYVVALCFGGATVNGAVEKSTSSVYTYDAATQSIVATVSDVDYRFGMEAGDVTTLDTMENGEEGTYARFYTLDEQGNPVAVENPTINETYLLGVAQEGKIYYATGKMEGLYPTLSDKADDAMDWKLVQKEGGFGLSHQVFEDGEPKLDKNNQPVYTCLNMIYSGGKGEEIATFISKEITPIITYISTIMVLLGLLTMYLSGEQALTVNKEESSKHEGEL